MTVASAAVTIDRVSGTDDIGTVARLAREIWTEHYVPIIGREQVDYMVPRFQSEAAVAAQMAAGLEYYLLRCATRPCGYFAIEPQPADGRLFISKLYVLREARRHGAGRAALGFITERARSLGIGVLWLTVNKYNPAVHAYERLGFRRVADIVMDIGGGYVMDDYRMERRVEGVGQAGARA